MSTLMEQIETDARGFPVGKWFFLMVMMICADIILSSLVWIIGGSDYNPLYQSGTLIYRINLIIFTHAVLIGFFISFRFIIPLRQYLGFIYAIVTLFFTIIQIWNLYVLNTMVFMR